MKVNLRHFNVFFKQSHGGQNTCQIVGWGDITSHGYPFYTMRFEIEKQIYKKDFKLTILDARIFNDPSQEKRTEIALMIKSVVKNLIRTRMIEFLTKEIGELKEEPKKELIKYV